MPRDSGALGRVLFRERRTPDRFDRFLMGLGLLALLALLVFHAVVLPLLLAAVLAYLLHPVVTFLHGRGVPRWLGTVLSYVVLVGGVVGFVINVIPKVRYEADRLYLKVNAVLEQVPGMVDSMEGALDALLGSREPTDDVTPGGVDARLARDRAFAWLRVPMGGTNRVLAEGMPDSRRQTSGELDVLRLSEGHYRLRLRDDGLRIQAEPDGSFRVLPQVAASAQAEAEVERGTGLKGQLIESLQNGLGAVSDRLVSTVVAGVQGLVTGVIGLVFGIFIVLMMAAYTLVDVPRMVQFVSSRLPPTYREGFAELLSLLDQGMRGVVRGQIVVCMVNFVLSLIGFSLFIPDYALILALVAGVLSFIPVLGSILSSIPAVLVGLADSFHTALLVLGWILGIHALEAYVLNPKILGTSARIHPVVIITAVLGGELVFGVAGAFLAVPVAAAFKAVLVFAYRRASPAGMR
jgi:predicted PurR-regulated permease PerM